MEDQKQGNDKQYTSPTSNENPMKCDSYDCTSSPIDPTSTTTPPSSIKPFDMVPKMSQSSQHTSNESPSQKDSPKKDPAKQNLPQKVLPQQETTKDYPSKQNHPEKNDPSKEPQKEDPSSPEEFSEDDPPEDNLSKPRPEKGETMKDEIPIESSENDTSDEDPPPNPSSTEDPENVESPKTEEPLKDDPSNKMEMLTSPEDRTGMDAGNYYFIEIITKFVTLKYFVLNYVPEAELDSTTDDVEKNGDDTTVSPVLEEKVKDLVLENEKKDNEILKLLKRIKDLEAKTKNQEKEIKALKL